MSSRRRSVGKAEQENSASERQANDAEGAGALMIIHWAFLERIRGTTAPSRACLRSCANVRFEASGTPAKPEAGRMYS